MASPLAALLLHGTLLANAPAGGRCVELIGTSDVHGHLDAERHKAGAFAVEQGSLPGFASYLDILRKKYPNEVLLLDAGDLFQGTVPSNFSKGAAVVAAYNAMHYDAVALGNHEFDYGPEGDDQDLLGAIKKRVAESHFPVLASNIYEASTHQRIAWPNLLPSKLVEVNGLKIGVIGAITPETPLVTIPTNVATLEFHDPVADVTEQAKALRAQGAQAVVLTTHIGGDCKVLSDHEDLTSCSAKSELFTMLDRLPKGTLDAVVAGHTHQYIAQHVDGAAVIESGYYGHSFGWVELCVNGKKVTTEIHQPTDVCLSTWAEGGCRERSSSTGVVSATFLGETIAPDAEIQKVIAPYLAKVEAFQDAPLGVRVQNKILRAHDRPSPLGIMVAQAMQNAVPGAQIGLTNAGGVRADLPSGPLLYKQVFEVLPFDNRVVGLRLTGKELTGFVVAPVRAGHGYPQLSGVKLVIDDPEKRDGHLEFPDGSKVVDDKIYLLATNDFLANGGDGAQPVVTTLPKDRRTTMDTLVRDAFIDYLKHQPQPVKAPVVP